MSNTKQNSNKKDVQIVVVKEPSLVVSVLEDMFTFGGAILVMWFNHAELGGNWFVDFVFLAIVFMTVSRIQTKRLHRFDTKAQAVKYLQDRS